VSNLGLSLLVGEGNSGGATFDSSIDVGNILTVVTILVSVSAVLLSLAKDRRTRERDLADRVRGAAARALAKLERWQELALAYYEDVLPAFVEASQFLGQDVDPTDTDNPDRDKKAAIAARDALWPALESVRISSLQRIREEEIETAYVDLYAFNVSGYERFRSTLARLKDIDQRLYKSFKNETQEPIFAMGANRAKYTTANLGDALRRTAERFRNQLEAALASEIDPLRSFLASIMAMNDQRLLRSRASQEEPGEDELRPVT
jgi:hypothetical protein